MKDIKDLVLRTEKVDWKKLKPFQPDDLKTMTKQSFEKLKQSIIQEGFATSFRIWEDKGNYWILDGHHRLYAIQALEQEGIQIPELLNCEFIDCKNKQQALRLIIRYSSNHAKVNELGLAEMMYTNGLDIHALSLSVDIPFVDVGKLLVDNAMAEVEPKPFDEKPQKKPVTCPNCDHVFVP